MHLEILGSSGTAPAIDNPASGYLVQTDQVALWMDAGPGTYMALLRHIDPGQLDAVLISHMHPDHCSDLFALFHELAYVRSDSLQVPVIAPRGSKDRISGFLQADQGHPIFETLLMTELSVAGGTGIGDLHVSVAEVTHAVPGLAFRIEGEGVSLGYTGDTGPSAAVTAHVTGVDLLLAEASLQDASEAYSFHMTARQAGEMARDSDAGRLVLTHIPRSLDSSVSLAEAAAAYSGPISLARPGDSIMISGTT